MKIEINTREHFFALSHVSRSFKVASDWWTGEAMVTTYELDEMLGTKLRALYQRRRGRDLFDVWHALKRGPASADRVIACFERYYRGQPEALGYA